MAKKEERETLKAAMEVLKNIAVNLNTCVIAIGAQNRESNKGEKVTMFSGLGSASLEYGADCVLVLSGKGSQRKLTAVKNRFGMAGAECYLHFDGQAMGFSQSSDFEEEGIILPPAR